MKLSDFWENVDIRGLNDCWPWTAGTFPESRGGYGALRDNKDGKTKRAHRIAFELAYGYIDSELQVCHTCDNPP